MAVVAAFTLLVLPPDYSFAITLGLATLSGILRARADRAAAVAQSDAGQATGAAPT